MQRIWRTIKSYPENNTICFTAYDNVPQQDMVEWLLECMPEFGWVIDGQVAVVDWVVRPPQRPD